MYALRSTIGPRCILLVGRSQTGDLRLYSPTVNELLLDDRKYTNAKDRGVRVSNLNYTCKHMYAYKVDSLYSSRTNYKTNSQ